MKGLKKKAFLLLFFPVFLSGYSEPKNPKMPVVQDEKKAEAPELPSESAGVKVWFYDGSLMFQGKILISNFTLSIVTRKSGFDFFKDLSLSGIKTIEILQWAGSLKDRQQGLYVFYPSRYQITDTLGTVFIYEKNIPALNQMVFESSLGKTRFFSYYYDYLKKDRWESTGRKDLSLETPQALGRVVKKFEFMAEEGEAKAPPKGKP